MSNLNNKITNHIYKNSTDDSECLRIKFEAIQSVISSIESDSCLFALSFSNWLDKNYIKKKGTYYHKGNFEMKNGERDKRKLIDIFKREII